MSDDKALNEFLSAFDEKKRLEEKRGGHQIRQIERKRKTLEPIRKLLSQFVEIGLVVENAQCGTPGVPPGTRAEFNYYESQSSPAWGPGVSLYFDHPAEVEIAIPNDPDIEKQGAIVIRSVTVHKDKLLLEKKFQTVEAAKDALAVFLGKNAVAIQRDPRINRAAKKVDESVLKSAPNEPPSESQDGKG